MKRYVIVEDNAESRKEALEIIRKMNETKPRGEYEISCHARCDEELEEIIEAKEGNNIYILDIELPEISGIDIATKVRRSGDYESVIIFLTNYIEKSMEVMKNNLMALNFIVKGTDSEEELIQVVREAEKIVGKVRSLVLEESGVLYRIDYNEILHIIKDTVERKTIVTTLEREFKFRKPLNEFIELLDGRFKQTHRSCIVNDEHVRKYDYKESKIYFKNGDYIYMLSRSGKKRLRKDAK